MQDISCDSQTERKLNATLQLKNELIEKLQSQLKKIRVLSVNDSAKSSNTSDLQEAIVTQEYTELISTRSTTVAKRFTSAPTITVRQKLHRWTRFDFTSDDKWNGCVGGRRYIKFTGLHTGAYVGVVLCSSHRYKIFISDTTQGMFLNVADIRGYGQDHCQFVGAEKSGRFKIDSENFWGMTQTEGYYRANWDEPLSFGNIGGFALGNWYNSFKWYECGVSIP